MVLVGDGVRLAAGMKIRPLFFVEKAVFSNLLAWSIFDGIVFSVWAEVEDGEEGDAKFKGTDVNNVVTSSKLRLYVFELAFIDLAGDSGFFVGEWICSVSFGV